MYNQWGSSCSWLDDIGSTSLNVIDASSLVMDLPSTKNKCFDISFGSFPTRSLTLSENTHLSHCADSLKTLDSLWIVLFKVISVLNQPALPFGMTAAWFFCDNFERNPIDLNLFKNVAPKGVQLTFCWTALSHLIICTSWLRQIVHFLLLWGIRVSNCNHFIIHKTRN